MAENGLGHLALRQNGNTGGYDNEGFSEEYSPDDLKKRKSVEHEEMQELTSENGHVPSSPKTTSLTNGYGGHSSEPPSPTLTNGSAMVIVNCEGLEEDDGKSTSHRNSITSSNLEDVNVNLNVDTDKELKCPLDTKLHHYVPVEDEGKMLNSGENTRIDIPDDAVINFNTGRIRVQHQQNKNHSPLPKVCHEDDEEKIPMQDMTCSLASLQEDSEKALEAAQNGRSSDEYSTDTATNEKQGNGGGEFDEYFIPVNTHKKYLRRGEKLYLTKDSEKLCKNWRRVIVCGLITIVIAVAILVGVLAATGILLAESESKNTRHEVSDQHLNDLSSVAIAGSHLGLQPKQPPSKFQPLTTAEIPQVTTIASQNVSQLNPIVPVTQPDLSQSHTIVPNALVGEFTIVDENFTNDLNDHTSYGFLSMATHVEDELNRVFKENGGIFHELRILQFRPGSIIVKFVVVWKSDRGVISAKQANQIMKSYFKDHGNRFLAFQVNRNSLNFIDVVDECRHKKGGCSHDCKWNYLNATKTCTCGDDMILSEDGKTCVDAPPTSTGIIELFEITSTPGTPIHTVTATVLSTEASSPNTSEQEIRTATNILTTTSTQVNARSSEESTDESSTVQSEQGITVPVTVTTIGIPPVIIADLNETTGETTVNFNNTAMEVTIPSVTVIVTNLSSGIAEGKSDDFGEDTTKYENALDTVFPYEITMLPTIVNVTTTETEYITTTSSSVEPISNESSVDTNKEQANFLTSTESSTLLSILAINTSKDEVIPVNLTTALPDDTITRYTNNTDMESTVSSTDVVITTTDDALPSSSASSTIPVPEIIDEPTPSSVSSTMSISDILDLINITTSVSTTEIDTNPSYEMTTIDNSYTNPTMTSVNSNLNGISDETNITLEDKLSSPTETFTHAMDDLFFFTTPVPPTESITLITFENETSVSLDGNQTLTWPSIASTKTKESDITTSSTMEPIFTVTSSDIFKDNMPVTTPDVTSASNMTLTVTNSATKLDEPIENQTEPTNATPWSYFTSLVDTTVNAFSTFYSSTTEPTSIYSVVPNKFNRTPAYRKFDNESDNIETTTNIVLTTVNINNENNQESTVISPSIFTISPLLFENATETISGTDITNDSLASFTVFEANSTEGMSTNDSMELTEIPISLSSGKIETESFDSNETAPHVEINKTETHSDVSDSKLTTDVTTAEVVTIATLNVMESVVTSKEGEMPVSFGNAETPFTPYETSTPTENLNIDVASSNETVSSTINISEEIPVTEANIPVATVSMSEPTTNTDTNISVIGIDDTEIPTAVTTVDSLVTDREPKLSVDETNMSINLNETNILDAVIEIEVPVTSSNSEVSVTLSEPETTVTTIEMVIPVTSGDIILPVTEQKEIVAVAVANVSLTPGAMESNVTVEAANAAVTTEEAPAINQTEVFATTSEMPLIVDEVVLANESSNFSSSEFDSEPTITISPTDIPETVLVDPILTTENDTEATVDDLSKETINGSESSPTTLTTIFQNGSTEVSLESEKIATTTPFDNTKEDVLTEDTTATDSAQNTTDNITSNTTEPTTWTMELTDGTAIPPIPAFEVNATMENLTTLDFMGKLFTNEDYDMFNTTLNDTVTDVTEGLFCREDQFQCASLNTCLNNTFICDGIEDCPDQVDESDCGDTCGLNFKCANSSTCVMNEAHCDGVWDCDDGSDEQNCTPTECAKHEVMCLDGSTCIKPGHICDWKYNCRDRSDEVGCVERTTCESGGRFFCNDGLCIPWSLKCDGAYDCKDDEDEGNCTCLEDEFKCNDGKCLKSSSRCDGHRDCIDNEDEMGCVNVDEQGIVTAFEPYSGSWSLICADDWNLDDGHYLCQELGFGHALLTENNHVSFNGTWMAMKRDNLTEFSLWTERVTFAESCSSNMAASVKCQKFDCGNYSGLLHRRRRRQVDDLYSPNTQWPFIAYVSTFKSNRGCLSEILTPVWLVTSAECLLSIGEPNNRSDWYVRTNVATGFNSDEVQNHEVLKITPHPHSSKFRSLILRDYDVALVRLKHSLAFSDRIGAICLPEEQVPSGITCFSGVLGSEKPRAPPPKSPTISSLALMLMDKDSCNTPEQYNNQINNRMLCTKSSETPSVCDNDEGSPLMCLSEPNKWYLAGMLTYQRYCGVYNWHPAVFSNLFAMRNFIDQVTGQKHYDIQYDSNMYVILPPTTIGPTEVVTESAPTMLMDAEATFTTPYDLLLNNHEPYSERQEDGVGMASDSNSTDESVIFNVTNDYFPFDNSTDLESLLGIEFSGENATVFITTTIGNVTIDDELGNVTRPEELANMTINQPTLIPELLPLNGTQKLQALKQPEESDYDGISEDRNHSASPDLTTTTFNMTTILFESTTPFTLDVSNTEGENINSTVEEHVSTMANFGNEESITSVTVAEVSGEFITSSPFFVTDSPTTQTTTTDSVTIRDGIRVVSEAPLQLDANVILDNKTNESAQVNNSSENNDTSLSARMLADAPLMDNSTIEMANENNTEKEFMIKHDNNDSLLLTEDSMTLKSEDANNITAVNVTDNALNVTLMTTNIPTIFTENKSTMDDVTLNLINVTLITTNMPTIFPENKSTLDVVTHNGSYIASIDEENANTTQQAVASQFSTTETTSESTVSTINNDITDTSTSSTDSPITESLPPQN